MYDSISKELGKRILMAYQAALVFVTGGTNVYQKTKEILDLDENNNGVILDVQIIEGYINHQNSLDNDGFIGKKSNIDLKKDFFVNRFISFLSSKKFIQKDIDYILRTSKNVVNAIMEEGNTNGLVYGQVQSGKTTHFSMLINTLLDNGIKNIIVLTSGNIALQTQTQERVEENIVGFTEGTGTIGVGEIESTPSSSIALMTSKGSNEVNTKDFRERFSSYERSIHVVKKK